MLLFSDEKKKQSISIKNHTLVALRLISKPGSLNPVFARVHNELTKNKKSLRKNKHYQGIGIYDLDGKLISKFKTKLS